MINSVLWPVIVCWRLLFSICFCLRWEGRREGDITRDHWLVMSTGKLSAESPLGGKVAPDISHFTLHSERYRPEAEFLLRGLCGPALFKHTQTGIMSILLQKTMDKISNLCLGTHKNKWKLGISVVLEYVLYRSQVTSLTKRQYRGSININLDQSVSVVNFSSN